MKSYTGLNNHQIEESRALHGSNTRTEKKRESFVNKLIKELLNPLVVILIIAAILTAVLGEYKDTIIITIAVLVNVIVALVQQGKASEAYKLLQAKKEHFVIVIRDEIKQKINANDLVVGDIVVINSGLYIPADMEVLESTELSANQVIFTGEAEPQKKHLKDKDFDEEAEHVFNTQYILFSGTTIASGSGVARVTAVGEHTEFSKIAEQLENISKDSSPIERQSQTIARAVSVLAGFIILLIVGLGIARDLPYYELLLLAISVAVSAVPEGLPSAITAILAYGATKIGREGGLVKNLSSAQTLGSTDIIFTDKTGTLTYGNMSVSQIISIDNKGDTQEKVIEHALLATDLFYDITNKQFVGDDVDKAIGAYFLEGGAYVNELLGSYISTSEQPFNSRNKFYSHTREKDGVSATYIKGAFGVIWSQTEFILDAGTAREKTKQDYEKLRFILESLSEQGKRVLAVAHTEGDKVIFDGLLVMEDQLRPDAIESVFHAKEAGIIVVMITGDAALTARSIAIESGIITDPNAHVINGSEIDSYTDEEVFKGIMSGTYRVFSRVTPEHKLRLVTLCSKRGLTVAMTGDGVNDSLALSKASIGISLSSGTDVAKESSDLILTNDSFSGIIFALREGRRVSANMTKTIIYLVATSFSQVLVIAGALVLALPVPFLPSHILWANILEEGLMNFAYLFEPNRSIQNKPRSILNRQVIKAIASIGCANMVLFLVLYIGLFEFTDTSIEQKRTYMFGALAVGALVLSWAVRTLSGPFWKIDLTHNKFFMIATGINIVLFTLTVGTEFGRSFMKLEPFDALGLWILLGFGILTLVSVEITKALFWKKEGEDDVDDVRVAKTA